MIVLQTTAIASTLDLKRLDREFALTNRLRTEATECLLAAARSAGVHKFLHGLPSVFRDSRVYMAVVDLAFGLCVYLAGTLFWFGR